MNIQKLIILGALKEGPKHGYQIKKFIKKELGVFTALENRSIYYPLKVMEQHGLIRKKVVTTTTQLTRHMYTITPRGSKEFVTLAKQALLSEKRPFIDIDIPLYFLPHLEEREVVARLRLRKRFLEKVKLWLLNKLDVKKEFPPHQRLLLKHHLNLLRAEENFVEEIVKVMKYHGEV